MKLGRRQSVLPEGLLSQIGIENNITKGVTANVLVVQIHTHHHGLLRSVQKTEQGFLAASEAVAGHRQVELLGNGVIAL